MEVKELRWKCLKLAFKQPEKGQSPVQTARKYYQFITSETNIIVKKKNVTVVRLMRPLKKD